MNNSTGILDTNDNIESQSDYKFLKSVTAEWLFGAAKYAKTFAWVSIVFWLISTVSSLVLLTKDLRNDRIIIGYSFYPELFRIFSDITEIIPLILILKFANQYFKAYKSNNDSLVKMALTSLKNYFFLSIMVIILSYFINFMSFFIIPFIMLMG